MQEFSLTIPTPPEHAATNHAYTEVVARMLGAKFILPGRHLDGPNLLELIRSEGVTAVCGVTTVWAAVLEHAEAQGLDHGKLLMSP
jgi:acyl-CoA synthetase (AMP-forming)/AMP-acid ligase II